MNFLYYHFPVSGVETYLFIPPVVMFLISTFVSMGGVTGAFVLLPFQMSILGYVSPGVSATNFVYNIIAIPLGVSRYIRKRQMCWLLFWIFLLGSLPGVFIGYAIRILYLPEPSHFKPFVGVVLGLLALRTLSGVWKKQLATSGNVTGKITTGHIGFVHSQICQDESTFQVPSLLLAFLSLMVGTIGGAYGIGGGAFLAPFCISVLNLPPLIVSGATLFSTWVISVIGALIYAFIPFASELNTSPDWLLGCLFGLGGMAGVYMGGVLQKRAPIALIRVVLGVALAFIALRYLI